MKSRETVELARGTVVMELSKLTCPEGVHLRTQQRCSTDKEKDLRTIIPRRKVSCSADVVV